MDQNPYAAPTASLDTAPADVVNRVGFWLRLGAALIDLTLLVFLSVILTSTIASMFPGLVAANIERSLKEVDSKALEQFTWMKPMLESVNRWGVSVAFVGTLYGLGEIFLARTPGKMFLGLRIAGADGRLTGLGPLALRWVLKQSGNLLSALGLFSGVQLLSSLSYYPSLAIFIGCFFVFGRRRQAFHDMLSKTAVYRSSDLLARL